MPSDTRDRTTTGAVGSRLERAIVRVLLLRPDVVRARLRAFEGLDRGRSIPNEWQVTLGVVRMLHRVVFRSGTIGTSRAREVRPTLRARVFARRPLRAPFLLRERAIAPLDLSGLSSSPDRVVRHLLGAHHDGNQFAYDLEMLVATPSKLDEVRREARRIVEVDDARSTFLRDLCVYEGYHESLLAACERASRGDYGLTEAESRDPDVSFAAYLAWCARQPTTLEETFALACRGLFHPMTGRTDEASASRG